MTPMEGKSSAVHDAGHRDVVVVMFIGGNIDQPVIIGGVWSKTDTSPEPNETARTLPRLPQPQRPPA